MAVRTLEALGFSYKNGHWLAADSNSKPLSFTVEADAMHAALIRRTATLAVCLEGSEEQAELSAIEVVIEAYETKRWPDGEKAGGKG
jgi:hypothetical protein